jgi:carboxylesterase
MKKILFFLVLLLFLTGCAEKYSKIDDSAVKISENIASLKAELNSDPNNTSLRNSLAEQMFSLELETAKLKGVSEENQPFFINKAGSTGILLIHGFTATPWEVRELGESLAAEGYNVYGTLLEGHGTNRADLRKTSWEDWYNDVKNSHEALAYISDKIFVVGVSTGGSLAILLEEDGYKVDGIVCLACPIFLRDKNTWLAPLLKYFYWYQWRNVSDGDKLHYYEYRPLGSVHQLTELIKHSSENIKNIDKPVLIIQNKNDSTVDPKSADFIYNNIGSSDKNLVYLEGDYHVLTKGQHKDEVFALIQEFIGNHS